MHLSCIQLLSKGGLFQLLRHFLRPIGCIAFRQFQCWIHFESYALVGVLLLFNCTFELISDFHNWFDIRPEVSPVPPSIGCLYQRKLQCYISLQVSSWMYSLILSAGTRSLCLEWRVCTTTSLGKTRMQIKYDFQNIDTRQLSHSQFPEQDCSGPLSLLWRASIPRSKKALVSGHS